MSEMTENSTLVDIRADFVLDDYNMLGYHVQKEQNDYVLSRIRFFWALPIIRHFAATKVKLLCTKLDTTITAVKDEKFYITVTQKVLLVGVSEFWSLLLLKRRK